MEGLKAAIAVKVHELREAARAERARQAAEDQLKALQRDDKEYTIASAKLKRALARINAAE